MQSQRVLDQGEVASIIAAAFSYNGLNATDIAFDVTGGVLRVIATVDEEPLRVRESPEGNGFDSMSADMLTRMRERSGRN